MTTDYSCKWELITHWVLGLRLKPDKSSELKSSAGLLALIVAQCLSIHLCVHRCVCPRQLESRVCTQHCASPATSTTGLSFNYSIISASKMCIHRCAEERRRLALAVRQNFTAENLLSRVGLLSHCVSCAAVPGDGGNRFRLRLASLR